MSEKPCPWGIPHTDGFQCVYCERAALRARVAELEALLRECNAVCLCGCPASEHESYGEDGEQCEHEDHECIRVAPAVLEIVNRLREAPAPGEGKP